MKEKLPNNKNIKSKKEILDKVYFFFLDANDFLVQLHITGYGLYQRAERSPHFLPALEKKIKL